MANIKSGDSCEIQCGTVFLSISGQITFHCMLCENKYDECQEYRDHVWEHHSNSNEIHWANKTDGFAGKEIRSAASSFLDFGDHYKILDESARRITEKIKDINKTASAETLTKTKFDKNIIQTELSILRPLQPRQATDIERKNFKCPHCEHRSKCYKDLSNHVRRHILPKQHQCTECPKAFLYRRELNEHMCSHTGERPVLCSECGRGFVSTSALGQHMKRHRNIRNKVCAVCNKRFYNSEHLKKHMVVHSEERPYKCNLCNSRFKMNKALICHLKLHENKRSYQCELCPAKFNQKPGLHSHMKSKHQGRVSDQVDT